MAGKKVMVLTTDEMAEYLKPSEAAASAYKFALDHAGLEMDEGAIADFIVKRNAKSGWSDLAEFGSWCTKTADSIKTILKHTFNVGTEEELPRNVSWSAQSYDNKFVEGAGAMVANALIAKKLVTKDALLNCLTVSNIAKASGLTVEKIMDMFPDTIEQKPKERALKVK